MKSIKAAIALEDAIRKPKKHLSVASNNFLPFILCENMTVPPKCNAIVEEINKHRRSDRDQDHFQAACFGLLHQAGVFLVGWIRASDPF
jgi:hypothetical protein